MSEKKYVEVGAVLEFAEGFFADPFLRIATRSLLAAAPAAPIVRCKDRTQWGGVTFGNVCRRWSAPLAGMKNCTGPDDFCSYGIGEWKDDGICYACREQVWIPGKMRSQVGTEHT